MTSLTGTPTLVRFILRRDRVRLPVWIIIILALIAITVSSVRSLYPTQESLDEFARTAEDNPVLLAMGGPAFALDTMGGRVAFEVSAQGMVVTALMVIFLVGRHTRSEEENGRTELLRATVLGPYAQLAATLLVATSASVVVGAGVTTVLVVSGLPVSGSVTLGAGFAAVGLLFAGITAVAAQVTEFTRGVYTAAIAALGVAYVLRAIGDMGDGRISLLSPIGLSQGMRPYADERYWPLLISLGAFLLLSWLALVLAARRDTGAALLRPRPGPPSASRFLTTPLGFALRLQRGTLYAWAGGIFLGGLAYGSIGKNAEELIGDNPDLADFIAQGGLDNLVDAFFGTTMLMLALIASGYSIQAALRPRGEETGGRAEPLLATTLGRSRWLASHLVVACIGSAVMLALAGLGTGLAHGLRTDDPGEIPRLTAAAMVYLPAMWALIGVTVALFGLLPRFAAAAWAGLAVCFVIGFLGEILQLPGWAKAISPFEHTPRMPLEELSVGPLFAIAVGAAALFAAGFAGFRQRDAG